MNQPPGSPSSTRLLVISDGRHGPTATQKISFGQPFEGIAGEASLQVHFQAHEPNRAVIARIFQAHRPDVLVLSRYTSELGGDWIGLARAAGIPVLFHIDDDLLSVPESLGEAKYTAYNQPARLKALRENIEGSDLFYVSTEELARRFRDHGIETPIIAGEIYCSVDPRDIGASSPPATGPVIGYMGTAGHSEDLGGVIPAICQVMEAVPMLRFELFGTIPMPAELGQFGSRVCHLPPVRDYSKFTAYLKTLGWWIGLAPLQDNVFNRCKADTKWVEYTLAGMAVVASDLPTYHRACADGAGILAKSSRDWSNALLTLLARPHQRSCMVSIAQDKLRESYNNERLRRQIESVVARAFQLATH